MATAAAAAAAAAGLGRLLVLAGPSGSGKSTLLKRLMSRFPGSFGFSVSHTTRSPRDGELPGREYHFVSRSDFASLVESNEFIEWAEFSGNKYGTSKSSVMEVMRSGRICVLDIDVQGVKQLKQLKPNLSPHLVFIRPPSLDDLKSRLTLRGTETEESLSRRLAAAAEELAYGSQEGNFHLVITNDDVDRAYNQLEEFVKPLLGSGGDLLGGMGDQ